MSSQILTKPIVGAEAKFDTGLLVGKPLKRKEDPRLLMGKSKFVDDIKLTEISFAAFLRSTYAHARIAKMDCSGAIRFPGVKLILTGSDIENEISPLPTIETDDGIEIPRLPLAIHEVTYVGEAIAIVVAETKQLAEDAIEAISVEYDPIPAVIDPETALLEDSPRARTGLKSNLVLSEKLSFGDIGSAFEKASNTVRFECLNQRLAPAPIETRGCVSSYDNSTGNLTVWISCQGPFQIRSDISSILRVPENKVRVIVPDVGGGFGAKLGPYPEEILVSYASMKLGLPVKWSETRTENFLSMTHGRGQKQFVEIASNDKGRILGVKVRLIGDAGAYLTDGSSDATFTIKMAVGQYRIPAYSAEALIVLTNKVPHDAYRGASRPEATYLIERAIDELARELRIDPVEVRLRNFIPKEDFPFDTQTGRSYDTGDYSMNLNRALELSRYYEWKEKQRRAIKEGRILGVGLASYVEICAFGPEYPETAALIVSGSGSVKVISGTSPHGQGHETPFAQIAADELGIKTEDISVVYGDTSMLPWGTFTAGSRSAALGGSAVLKSAKKIREKMAKIAAIHLNCSSDDLIFKDEKIFSKADQSRKIEFAKIAEYAYRPKKLPPGVEPTLFEFSVFVPKNFTFPFGTHVAVVELDPETGKIAIEEYTSVDDCGNVLNPLVVEGQIHGGITQGLGQALLEGVRYDENGHLLTSSFLDYQIPLAEDVPNYNAHRTVTPTDSNPLGIKGIGEAGTIAATPTLANAIADALAQYGIKLHTMPITPELIISLLKGSNVNKRKEVTEACDDKQKITML